MDERLEHHAEKIFDSLMQLPISDRHSAMLQACGDDAALLDRVDSLLSALGEATAFLTDLTLTSQGSPAPIADSSNAISDVGVGSQLGHYKLLQVIGEGGCGIVYMAAQKEPVQRKVAVKVIKPGMDTKEVIARFEAERQAIALMDHPNIARIFDAGTTPAGRPFFVMELVVGVPITTFCDTNLLSTRQRLELIVPVCRAVQSAHQKGIIHRDIKPANVLVTLQDGQPMPRVIDFGIAKATGTPLTDHTLFTAFHQFVGTPAYMSPEQTEMNGVDVDTRTDVYGLGVLLYELLTGTTPVDSKALKLAAYAELGRLIRESEPATPSSRLSTLGGELSSVARSRGTDPTRLGQLVRGELDWIVMKALEKDRSRRYDTAAALAEDLGRYLNGEPVAAGPPGGVYRLRKFARKHKVLIGTSAAVAASLIAGLALMSYGFVREIGERRIAERLKSQSDEQRQDADHQRAIAEHERANAEQQRDSNSAMLEFLTSDLLDQLSPEKLPDKAARDALANNLIGPAQAGARQRFKGKPAIEAQIREQLAVILDKLGRADLALPESKAVVELFKTARGEQSSEMAMALTDYAGMLREVGRCAEAEPIAKQAWDLQRRLGSADDWFTMQTEENYVLVLFALGRCDQAAPLAKEVWERAGRVLGESSRLTVEAFTNYAGTLYSAGEIEKSLPLAKRALSQSERVLGLNDPNTMSAMTNYACCLASAGRYEESTPLAKQAWEHAQLVLGDDHPRTLALLQNYATDLIAIGQSEKAAPLFQQIYESKSRVKGPDNPDTIQSQGDYAGILGRLGTHQAEAQEMYKQACGKAAKVFGTDDERTVDDELNYANLLMRFSRQPDQAIPLLQHALAAAKRKPALTDLPGMQTASLDLAKCLMQLHRDSEAAAVCREYGISLPTTQQAAN